MKIFRVLAGTLGAAAFVACTSGKISRPAPSRSAGKGTLNLSGALSKTISFGGSQPNRRVSCVRDPALRISEIRLTVTGQPTDHGNAQEGLLIQFKTPDFPIGRYNFTANDVSYSTPAESYQSGTGSCYIVLAHDGALMKGELTCNGLENENRDSVDVTASFQCLAGRR